jgi:hypothetical protein
LIESPSNHDCGAVGHVVNITESLSRAAISKTPPATIVDSMSTGELFACAVEVPKMAAAPLDQCRKPKAK